MDYTDLVIERKFRALQPQTQARALAYLEIIEAHNTWPHVERRSAPQNYHMLSERRTPRLPARARIMLVPALAMMLITIVSLWMAAKSPLHLLLIPFTGVLGTIGLVGRRLRARLA